PALVLELVGDDPLEARDERRPAAPRPQEAVEVHTDDEIDPARRRERDAQVVEPAVQRMNARAPAERPQLDPMAQSGQTACEPGDADERAAALERVQRSGGQDGDAQSSRLSALELRRPPPADGARPFPVAPAAE